MNQAGELRFEGPGEVLRRRVSLLFGAAALFVMSLVLEGMGAPAWGALLEQALAVCLVVSFSWNAYRATRKGVLFADASGLRLGDEKIAERSRIAAAFLVTPEEPLVRILRRGGLSVDVRLESEEKARALLTALGLGIGQSIASFSARCERGPVTVVIPLAVMTGVGALSLALFPMSRLPAHAPFVLIFGGSLALRHLLSFVHVDVGSDGVLIRQLGGQRFISFGSMASASVASAPRGGEDRRHAIALALRSGEHLRLIVGSSTSKAQLRDALLQRIDDAREAFAGHVDAEGAMALVAPGGRTLNLWMSDVRALAGALHYRETRLDEDRLWRVLDDAAAPPATRAGAALAISVLDQPARLRLRVAAEACAEPKLRVALSRVANGASDPELEEALAPLLERRS